MCWAEAGVELDVVGDPARSGTEAIHRGLERAYRLLPPRRVRAGDLLFFHNTYDRNGNGHRDDRFSHVAIVESVDEDGTVHFVHYASGAVRRAVLNLGHPFAESGPADKRWNEPLRRGRGVVLGSLLLRSAGRPR